METARNVIGIKGVRNHSAAIVMGLVAMSIVGCSSNPPAERTIVIKDETAKEYCTFPDSPGVDAPLWVCTEQLEDVSLTAVGYARMSAGGIAFTKQIAAASARVTLAQRMKVHVSNMVKDYAESTGTADNEVVDRVRTSVSKQVSSETLAGTKVYNSVVSPGRTMYVIVGLDKDQATYNSKEAIRSSYNGDSALWQQFRASVAQDELADAIAGINQ